MTPPARRRVAAEADRRRALQRTARANELARRKAQGEATDDELAELAALVEKRRAGS